MAFGYIFSKVQLVGGMEAIIVIAGSRLIHGESETEVRLRLVAITGQVHM